MTVEKAPANHPWTPNNPTTPDGYMSNVEYILVQGGHVTTEHAAKVAEVSPRALWYGHEVVVLPSQPDPDFVDYVRSFGCSPTIVVPGNTDMNKLSIRDGMTDPAVERALRGKWVESYIGDGALYLALQERGIRYGGGDPGESIRKVNDKGNFAALADGLVAVPPGTLHEGVDVIAQATLDRIQDEGSAFVRLTESGGGFGNRLFVKEELQGMTRVQAIAHIRTKLGGSRPDLWEKGSALVERVLELKSSPSINFNTLSKNVYDGEQITYLKDYQGCWLPAPPSRYDQGHLQDIGHGMRERVIELDFWGRGGVDLGIASAKSMETEKDVTVAFENNGRSTAQRHVVDISEIFWGPFDEWTKTGKAVKARDHFVLNGTYSFKQLHYILGEANLLATPENPFGVVISIPPENGVAGIVVLGKGYEETELLYRRMSQFIGKEGSNAEDYPLFTQDMQLA